MGRMNVGKVGRPQIDHLFLVEMSFLRTFGRGKFFMVLPFQCKVCRTMAGLRMICQAVWTRQGLTHYKIEKCVKNWAMEDNSELFHRNFSRISFHYSTYLCCDAAISRIHILLTLVRPDVRKDGSHQSSLQRFQSWNFLAFPGFHHHWLVPLADETMTESQFDETNLGDFHVLLLHV